VVRARAEGDRTSVQVRRDFDVVTARAVAPLVTLAGWGLPLLRDGGELLAIRGESASAELGAARPALVKAGGIDMTVVRVGDGIVDPPTTVVRIVSGAKRR
jgi:16S rRNA (guanine527-N7)-methyltransferase